MAFTLFGGGLSLSGRSFLSFGYDPPRTSELTVPYISRYKRPLKCHGGDKRLLKYLTIPKTYQSSSQVGKRKRKSYLRSKTFKRSLV